MIKRAQWFLISLPMARIKSVGECIEWLRSSTSETGLRSGEYNYIKIQAVACDRDMTTIEPGWVKLS